MARAHGKIVSKKVTDTPLAPKRGKGKRVAKSKANSARVDQLRPEMQAVLERIGAQPGPSKAGSKQVVTQLHLKGVKQPYRT